MALLAPVVARADDAQYGANDAGGFRHVLPPGEAGIDNAVQLAQFQANGTRPPHWADQQPLYDNLLYASQSLSDADVPKYYKDASFGVKPEYVASVEHPRAGVTIVRAKPYGIPHVYGDTDESSSSALATRAPRTGSSPMDVLRHTSTATSSTGGATAHRTPTRPASTRTGRPTVGVDMPPFRFQNRPTFQQTVSLAGYVGR